MDNPLENRYAAMPSSEEVAEYYGSLPLAEEVPFHEYLYERWVDDPKTWSPLITLEQLEQRPNLEVDWYCLFKRTKILTSNLEWKTVEEIEVGEELIGFDEENVSYGNQRVKSRRFRPSTVESKKIGIKPCYTITTKEGCVVSSDNHKWLVVRKNGHSPHTVWRETKDLKVGDTIYFWNSPWEFNESSDAGYLRGILDGEGCICNGNISISQNAGIVLDNIERILQDLQYPYTKHTKPNDRTFTLKCDLPTSQRILGEIRPYRLLMKSRSTWENRGVFGTQSTPSIITSLNFVGNREIVGIQTSTHTLIANGFLSHNCTDWIPVGAKVLLAAEPKCGKTILLFHILNSILHGKPFLGKKSTPAKVIYLTEQTEHEFKRQIKEVPGLAGNPNFYVLLAEEFPTDLSSWRRLLQFVEEKMVITGAKIVVFDTFLGMAKLPPDGENDSATIQNCINESNFLFKNRYLSVVFVHHNRKRSDDPKMRYASENIQSIRGSSAFAGGVGHIIEMSAPNMNDTARKFNFYGRYIHGSSITLTLLNSQYHLNQYAR